MNKQQVLQIMELESLPQPIKQSNSKCIALVERASGEQDYVIANGGGVIMDKQPMSAVRKIVEFYPVVKGKKVEEVIVEEPVIVAPTVIVAPVVVEEYNRDKAIQLLVFKGMNEAKMRDKTDEELKKYLKVYNK